MFISEEMQKCIRLVRYLTYDKDKKIQPDYTVIQLPDPDKLLVCDDLIDGMIRLMNSGDDVTGPINIGNPSEFTILELAQKVIELTGSKSKIIYMPLPQDDPMQRKPVIELAREKLGWEPKIALEDGLKKTIEYFENQLEG